MAPQKKKQRVGDAEVCMQTATMATRDVLVALKRNGDRNRYTRKGNKSKGTREDQSVLPFVRKIATHAHTFWHMAFSSQIQNEERPREEKAKMRKPKKPDEAKQRNAKQKAHARANKPTNPPRYYRSLRCLSGSATWFKRIAQDRIVISRKERG